MLGYCAFKHSTIENIKLPSTLKRIEAETFYNCRNLKSVEIPGGVEYIGRECFCGSGIEEVVLPDTLRATGDGIFNRCSSLKTVWAEEDCTLDVKKYVDDNVVILSMKMTVGRELLWDLRR